MAFESLHLNQRQEQIIEILQELEEATATEIAYELLSRGYVTMFDRNAAAPRLTEMSQEGIVEPIGQKKCSYQGKMVSVYAFTNEFKNKYLGGNYESGNSIRR